MIDFDKWPWQYHDCVKNNDHEYDLDYDRDHDKYHDSYNSSKHDCNSDNDCFP